MIFTHAAITRHLTAWCAEHMGHEGPGMRAYQRIFDRNLAVKRAAQLLHHDNGGVFGMSKAYGCLRAAALSRAGIKGKPLDGDTRATFEFGDLGEVFGLSLLEASGFDVRGRQRPAYLPPAFRSAIDGELHAGPVPLPYPVLLSVKTASYKSSGRAGSGWKRYGFAALPLDGIAKAQPDWYAQSQLEMLAAGMGPTLVLVVAKDMIKAFEGDPIFQESGSLTFYAELVLRDPDAVAHLIKAHGAILHSKPESVPPLYPVPGGYVTLPAPGHVAMKWDGPNKPATGRFNPCFGCAYGGRPEVCR